MRKSHLALLLTLVLVFASVDRAEAITNGSPDGNRHPYVGLIRMFTESGTGWRCSGALLTPTLVLTAGHCTAGGVTARIWFDEDVENNAEYPHAGATSYEGTPYTHPEYCTICTNSFGLPFRFYRDVGVVVLSEPVPTSVVATYAVLPAPGFVDTLLTGTPVDLVGYGVQEKVNGAGWDKIWTGLRVRLYAPTELVSGSFTNNDDAIKLSSNASQGKGGMCFGDSGGPDLLGGTNLVLAVNSHGSNLNCSGVAYSNRIDIPDVLAWIDGFR